IFGKGISAIGSLLDCAVKYDIIKKSGAWYSYNDEKIGQGRENCKEYMEQHPDFCIGLENKLRQQIFPGREFSQIKPSIKSAAPAEPKPDAVKAAPQEQKLDRGKE
ncbi:MAG: recombinase RecA, partial [Treponema sp.]|nr:recombinase RecA [Treponema sp.]